MATKENTFPCNRRYRTQFWLLILSVCYSDFPWRCRSWQPVNHHHHHRVGRWLSGIPSPIFRQFLLRSDEYAKNWVSGNSLGRVQFRLPIRCNRRQLDPPELIDTDYSIWFLKLEYYKTSRHIIIIISLTSILFQDSIKGMDGCFPTASRRQPTFSDTRDFSFSHSDASISRTSHSVSIRQLVVYPIHGNVGAHFWWQDALPHTI